MSGHISRRYRRLAMDLVTKGARLLDGFSGIARLRQSTFRDSPVRRILVVELWNIGDVVLTMPFLAQLRAIFPGAEVTLLGQEHAEILLRDTGLVDSFIRTNLTWRDADQSFRPGAYHWAELARTVRDLRRRNFDLAFQAKLHLREHALLAGSGARRTVGYSPGDGFRSALTDTISPRRGVHRTDDWFALLAPFGGAVPVKYPPLHVTDAEKRWADGYLADRNIGDNDVLVGVHPGASVADKRWPLDKFAEILETLTSRPGVRALVFIEPSGYGASLTADGRIASARVSLRQLLALISRCRVLLCNDSGPMHIAGALGVPTVGVFGSAVAKSFSPLGQGHEIVAADTAGLSREVERMALENIPVAAVQQALERVLRTVTAASVPKGNDIDCGLA